MTVRKPLVLIGGTVAELPAGDVLAGLGDLSALTTAATSDIVAAINEIVARLVALEPTPATDGWNTTALEAGLMTFSNGNHTVVGNNSGGTGDNRCRSDAAKSTGKWFASISIDAYEYGDVSVTDSDDHNYVHYAYDGTIWSSAGSVLATISAYAAPCVIDMCCDTDNHLVWFRKDGGNWNGSAANDPDAGTGGYALPVSAQPYHAKAQMPYFPASQRTLNTGTAAFAFPPPSSFPALRP